jgi:hypothetical protein
MGWVLLLMVLALTLLFFKDGSKVYLNGRRKKLRDVGERARARAFRG